MTPTGDTREDRGKVAFTLELPPQARRDWLLAGLVRVIARTGFETFVGSPIVLPSGDYFPAPWDGSLSAAGSMLCRLMRYAGLDGLGVRLTGFRNFNPDLGGGALVQGTGSHAAAWFAGIERGVARFGVDVRNLGDGPKLVAALAHEVAHAFRHHHRLVVQDHDVEEQLTDLTAVYLGFGVFLLNASHHVKTGGYGESGQRMAYERTALGYLAPEEFAFLLAAQVAVRESPPSVRRALEKALSPNQARLFEMGCKELRGDEAELLRRDLRIPLRAQWPTPVDTADFIRRGDGATADIVEPRDPDTDSARAKAKIAFRVKGAPAWVPVLACGAVAPLLGLAVDTRGVWLGVWIGCGLLIGGLLGARQRAPTCSDCRAGVVDPGRCAYCGARFVGDIRSRADRLEADERYAERKRLN